MSVLDTLRAIARAESVSAPENETNEKYEQTPGTEGVASLNSFISSPERLARTSANEDGEADQNAAPEASVLDERAALIEYGTSVPRRWAEGYAALCTMAPPSGFSPERWQRIVDGAGRFMDRWAVNAAECGWTALDVFGADPDRPDRRFDCMGLLFDRCEILSIDEHGADLRYERVKRGDKQRNRLDELIEEVALS
jgi:hypothetical protein